MNYREWNTQWNNWALVRARSLTHDGHHRPSPEPSPLIRYPNWILFSLILFHMCNVFEKKMQMRCWRALVLTFYRVTLFFAAVPRKWSVHYWTPKTKDHDNLQCLRNLYHYTISSFNNHYVIIANNNVLLLIK